MPAQPLLVVAGELCRAFGVAAIFGSDLDDDLIKKVTLPNDKNFLDRASQYRFLAFSRRPWKGLKSKQTQLHATPDTVDLLSRSLFFASELCEETWSNHIIYVNFYELNSFLETNKETKRIIAWRKITTGNLCDFNLFHSGAVCGVDSWVMSTFGVE